MGKNGGALREGEWRLLWLQSAYKEQELFNGKLVRKGLGRSCYQRDKPENFPHGRLQGPELASFRGRCTTA